MAPRVAVLDVGHGNAALVEGDGATLLVDCGGKGSGLLEYLRTEGITRIDVVLLSHADQDHIGGLLGVLSSGIVEVGIVRLNTDSSKGSQIWDDLLFELSNRGEVDFRPSLTSEDSFDPEPFQIQLLSPTPYLAGKGAGSVDREGRRLTTNTMSAVVRIHLAGEPILLLPGDLDFVGLLNLEEAGVDCTASVLVFPHHGGDPGGKVADFVERLLRLCIPHTVLFSTGRARTPPLPRPEVIHQIASSLPEAWIACTQLSKHCCADQPAERPGFSGAVFAKGQATGSCCAGSVVLELSDAGLTTWPPRAEHRAFIDEAVPSPMCLGPASD